MNGESKTKDILSSEQASFIKNKTPISVVNQPKLDVSICSDPISKIKPDQCAMVSDSSRQKKSLFQITRIVNNSVGLDRKLTEIVESMSDSSLPVLINGSVSAESINSGVKSIDAVDGNYLSSMDRKTSQQLIGINELSDSSRLSHHSNVPPSRFKVVRIASHKKPIIKGRWSCQDFVFDKPIQGQYISGPAAKSPKMTFHQAGGSGDDKPTSNDSGSEGSSLVNSIYYVQSGDEDLPYLYDACGMVYANGHLTLNDIQRDAHSSGYSSATVVPNSSLLVEHTFTINDVYNLMGPECGTDHLDPLTNEMAGIPELSDADSCGAANPMCALDNKIEQAMDLVKSHLMFAVHEEVEQLKEQIKDLMIRRSVLEQENSILRASATPETLARLKAMLASKAPSTPETDQPLPDCNDSLNDGIEQSQPSS